MKKRKRIELTAIRRTVFALFAILLSTMSFAQGGSISGEVVDVQGEPIIGASVVLKGTSQGVMTDIDGHFNVSASAGSTLVISYIGYETQEVKAADGMRVVLQEESTQLGDVVVIGYGVQKKSVVTAAIAKVSASDLEGTAPVRMDNALKGLAAGVNVTSSSGQPGAGARIRIRGTGTVNDSDPLYIVDGMPIEGGLDYINPSDIESIEVLKDAASGAIYGARAANGVVLVTTKKGKLGKPSINYNFSYGWQNPWKHVDVLDATQYALLRNESLVNAGLAPAFSDPYSLGKGTDWQDVLFNDNAPVSNHEVTVSGASERVNYYLSLGYYDAEGIVGGNFNQSNYNRLTMRSNLGINVFDATKERNWLNKLDVTINLSYARVKSSGINPNDQYGSRLGEALSLPPTIAAYVDPADEADYIASMRNQFPDEYSPLYLGGRLVNLPGISYNELSNPLAGMALPASQGWSHKFVTNFSATLGIWDALKYRISYSTDMSFWGSDWYSIPNWTSPTRHQNYSQAGSESDRGTVWQLENVLSYDKTIGKHTFGVVLGQSAFENSGHNLGGTRRDLRSYDKPYISAAEGLQADGKMNCWGGPATKHTMSSLFGRISYNYDERYMFQGTIRRDGSSRFGSNNKYGTFPSASVGWNIMNEAFMENTRDWLSNMKLRLSWGKNGSDNIGNFLYTVYTQGGNNYAYGAAGNEKESTSTKAAGLANPDVKWEESEQFDAGLDFGFFGNALTFTVDYFKKKTNGMLKEMPIPSYVGESFPIGNVGDMENSGIEFELGYKWNVSDAKFSVKSNVTYLKNKLIRLGNSSGFQLYDNVQERGNVSRAQNGEPFPYFYGYKTNGIFQNQEEIDNYTWMDLASGEVQVIQPDAKPGDIRFVDINNDGQINDDDRTKIGKGTPDWTFGFTFNAAWRGFDFMMFWQGTAGNDIYDATHRNDLATINMPTYYLSRWTGEGTSNSFPRLEQGNSSNWVSSDLYVSDGSYLRLKNIELGYTLPENLTRKALISRLRFYVSAENLITWTKYHGFDPEISTTTSNGIDYGIYPQARVWRVGLNLTF